MSSIYVPDELLESIFSFIHDKTSQPTPLSQRTFASLALTSKRFLPLSRSHLYYRPIPPPSFASHVVTWRKALSLESALSSPLGQLVVSLEGIVDFVSEVGTLKEPSSVPFQLRGCTEAFSLYRALLAACGKLEFVELIFDSTEHLARLSMALEGSTSTLRTVKFMNSKFSEAYRVNAALVTSALRRDRFKGVKRLVVEDVDPWPMSELEPSTCLPLNAISLTSRRSTPFARLQGYLPCDSSFLSSVSIIDYGLAKLDLIWILDYVPTSLTDLNVSAIGPTQVRVVTIGNYSSSAFPSIPSSQFARHTALTKLSLNGFDGPSIALLENLSSALADSLNSLDFAKCKWISTSCSIAPTSTNASLLFVVDPQDLLARLLKFRKLRRVHLGILPTTERETYRDLDQELNEKRGIEVDYQICRKEICRREN